MQTLTTETTITDETAYLPTEAGMDALRECQTPDTEEETAAPEGFRPTTEAEIDWVLRKINDARARAARRSAVNFGIRKRQNPAQTQRSALAKRVLAAFFRRDLLGILARRQVERRL